MESSEELKIFRAVVGSKKIITNSHTNIAHGNRVSDGNKNQGISKAKLVEFVKKEGLNYEYWKNL